MANSADPDQKPACKDRIYSGSAGQGLKPIHIYVEDNVFLLLFFFFVFFFLFFLLLFFPPRENRA